MKKYKVTIEATIDVPDYVSPDAKEQTPADLTAALLRTSSPKTNGYAVCTLGKLTATLHVDAVSFKVEACPCGMGQMHVVEKIP